MIAKQKVAIAGAGLFGLIGIGVGSGVAFAQSSPSTPPPAVSSTPAPAPATIGPNTAPKAPEAPEAQGAEVEKPAVEEPGDAALPGGGHADPVGQDVDHQFQGVE